MHSHISEHLQKKRSERVRRAFQSKAAKRPRPTRKSPTDIAIEKVLKEEPTLTAKQVGGRLRKKGIAFGDASLASKVSVTKKKLREAG